MNAGGRPAGSSNEAQISAAEQVREDERHLRAIRGYRGNDIQAVRLRHRIHKMSRKRLIEIYGRDLVDEALGGS